MNLAVERVHWNPCGLGGGQTRPLSYRQTAEWGMHTLQGSFGRLHIPLPINHSDLWGDLLETVSRLFNLCARAFGHNQIQAVYMPIWREDEQEELWMSFEGMLFLSNKEMIKLVDFMLHQSRSHL